MSTWNLITNATAVQTAFSAQNPVTAPSQMVTPAGQTNANNAVASLGVSVSLTATSASASGVVVVMATNDDVTMANPQWFDIGCTVTASGATGVAATGSVISAPYRSFTAYLKTVTGTSTSVTGKISA